MKNNTKKSLKTSNGITLIALVITIIVLLILSGIAISMLTGDNSILKRAGEARDKTDLAGANEQLALAYINEVGSKILGDTDSISLKNALDKTGYEYKEGGAGDNVSDLKITEDAEGTKEITGSFNIAPNSNNTVYIQKVTSESGGENKTYYVKVSEKYHKVLKNGDNVKLEEAVTPEADITGGNTGTYKVAVTSSDESKQYVDVSFDEATGKVTIKATDKATTTAVTIKAKYVNENDSNDVKISKTLSTNVEIKIAEGKGTKPFLPTTDSIITNNDLDTGLTIKDSNQNEWVWIEVPNKKLDATATFGPDYTEVSKLQQSDITGKTDAYYTAIATDLRNYCAVAKDGTTTLIATTGTKSKTTTMGGKDEWYDGCGVVDKDEKTGAQRYKDFYYAMLDSIYTNGGFYIGKYETGYKTTGDKRAAKNENQSVSDLKNAYKPLIQVDAYPYNYVTCSQAEGLSETLATGGKNCTLMFGIQWDLVLKYLNVKGGKEVADLTSDSKDWGNYYSDTITITNSNAQSATSKPYSSFNKATTTSGLLTTGASSDAGPLNIFDLAGNVWEWTLEHVTANTSYPCAIRGGYFNDSGSHYPASYRNSVITSYGSDGSGGFRCTLY